MSEEIEFLEVPIKKNVLSERLRIKKENILQTINMLPQEGRVEDISLFLDQMEEVQKNCLKTCSGEWAKSLEDTISAVTFLKSEGLLLLRNGTEKDLLGWIKGIFAHVEEILSGMEEGKIDPSEYLRNMEKKCQKLESPEIGRYMYAIQLIRNQYFSLKEE